jgi:hypothetical protein
MSPAISSLSLVSRHILSQSSCIPPYPALILSLSLSWLSPVIRHILASPISLHILSLSCLPPYPVLVLSLAISYLNPVSLIILSHSCLPPYHVSLRSSDISCLSYVTRHILSHSCLPPYPVSLRSSDIFCLSYVPPYPVSILSPVISCLNPVSHHILSGCPCFQFSPHVSSGCCRQLETFSAQFLDLSLSLLKLEGASQKRSEGGLLLSLKETAAVEPQKWMENSLNIMIIADTGWRCKVHCPKTLERNFNLGVLNLYEIPFMALFSVKYPYPVSNLLLHRI